MKLKTVGNLFGEGFENIGKNKLLTFMTSCTVFISLTLFSVFYIFINIINTNINIMQERIEIVAFIDDNIDEEGISELKDQIENIENIKSVEYISKEDGLEELSSNLQEEGDTEMISIINQVAEEEGNPIPASFSIKTVDTKKNSLVKDELGKIEKIYKVSDSNVVTTFLNNLNKYSKIVGTIILGILMIATIMLVSNSIKVAVFIRKKEIGIIKYIGATNWYIRLPFIIEGVVIGIIGGVVSLLAVGSTYSYLNDRLILIFNNLINGFTIPSIGSLLMVLAPTVLIVAVFIGICGSMISIRRYLRV